MSVDRQYAYTWSISIPATHEQSRPGNSVNLTEIARGIYSAVTEVKIEPKSSEDVTWNVKIQMLCPKEIPDADLDKIVNKVNYQFSV
jgi:hypothetical protein